MIELAAFDLDGTLLNTDRKVSELDYQTLLHLGKKNILRVAATGRNFYSISKLLPANFPIDYAVISSGAGIVHWPSKKVLLAQHLNKDEIEKAVHVFLEHRLSFTIHKPIPDTHNMFLYSQSVSDCDLSNYTQFYKDFLQPLNLNKLPIKATQLIGLLHTHKEKFEAIQQKLTNLKLVLTTSPVNHSSLWVEVFNKQVSKANGVLWLCEKLNINQLQTFGIGNDYNDIDLLGFTNYSFVVSNGIDELKKKYQISQSNNQSGFTFAIKQCIQL